MAGSKYNWDKIYSDTEQLISECIKNKEAVPTFLSKMYQILEKDYKQKGKAIPTKRIYVQKMRSMLSIPNTKRNIQADLYRLVGWYDKMTLQLLSARFLLSIMLPGFSSGYRAKIPQKNEARIFITFLTS